MAPFAGEVRPVGRRLGTAVTTADKFPTRVSKVPRCSALHVDVARVARLPQRTIITTIKPYFGCDSANELLASVHLNSDWYGTTVAANGKPDPRGYNDISKSNSTSLSCLLVPFLFSRYIFMWREAVLDEVLSPPPPLPNPT